jgi:hypothetical protein
VEAGLFKRQLKQLGNAENPAKNNPKKNGKFG